jgi:hypothetical protein
VPWSALCRLIAPHYPEPGNGRPAVGVGRMLRIHFLQHWLNLSDPAVEEALHDSQYAAIIALASGLTRSHREQHRANSPMHPCNDPTVLLSAAR